MPFLQMAFVLYVKHALDFLSRCAFISIVCIPEIILHDSATVVYLCNFAKNQYVKYTYP